MKKTIDKTTKDSIEALEALLKIRERNEQASSTATTPTAGTSTSSTISPSNNLPSRARNMSIADMSALNNQANGNQTQVEPNISNFPFLLNSQQTQNAAGISSQKPISLQASQNRLGNVQMPYSTNLSQQQLQIQQHQQLVNTAASLAFSSIPLFQDQGQHSSVSLMNFDPRITQNVQPQNQSSHSALNPTLNDIIQPSAPGAATMGGRTLTPIAMSHQSSGISTGMNHPMEVKKDVIRKEEIEAALKSKPQRGRKRENLSGLERQELTRTRNREHAKTTRIRKKARYEELVACEKKYLELREMQDFEEGRKVTIVKFMMARSKILEPKDKVCNDTNSWNFSFENDPSCKTEENSMQALSSPYEEVIIDCSTFSVDICTGLSRVTTANLFSFQAHDKQVISPMRSKTAQETNVSFAFKIKGGKNGIALNNNDEGFAQCELSVSLDTKEDKQVCVVLKTDLLQVKFAKESKKISSMKIFGITDGTASFSPAKLHEAEFCQASYPSVVSLEQS